MNYFIHYALTLIGLCCILLGITELVLLYSQPLYAVWSSIAVALSIWFTERMRQYCVALSHGFSNLEIYQHAN